MQLTLLTILALLILFQSFHVQWTIERYTVLKKAWLRNVQSWGLAIIISSMAFICVYLERHGLAITFTALEVLINWFYFDRKSLPMRYEHDYKNTRLEGRPTLSQYKRKEYIAYVLAVFIPSMIYVIGWVYTEV